MEKTHEAYGFSKRYMSVNQLAKEYDCHREKIYELVRRPDQNFATQMKIRGKIRCDVVKFMIYIEKNNIVKRG